MSGSSIGQMLNVVLLPGSSISGLMTGTVCSVDMEDKHRFKCCPEVVMVSFKCQL